MELGVLGPLQVRQYGLPVTIPGAKPRAILTVLGLHGDSVVSAATLVELLWGDDPPRTATKALQTHISALRRALGDGFVLTEGTGWSLRTTEVDAIRYKAAAKLGRDALAAGDAGQAVAHFDEALALWRGVPELPDGTRGSSEKTRWIESHAALVEDRADALLATGRAAEIIGELEAAVADAPLRERRWGHLMLALYRAGRQGEALGAYQRARSVLAEELGVDPGPDLRRLDAAIVAQDRTLESPVSQHLQTVTRAVTFLLTDIEGSTAAWEADPDAMALALARHDELVEQVVTSRGGRLVKTRGEGDATFSVFDRPSAASAAAIELQEAIRHEPWALQEPIRIRVALHTGEVELRDGDYFGRAVNRAARLRSLATGGQILCSGATAELVIDSLSDDVVLADLGMRQLRNLARPEHVFELRLMTADDDAAVPPSDAPMERPPMPAALTGAGPFVGRGRELEGLFAAWQTSEAAGTRAVLIAGEPGVGKTRLAGEWSRLAYGHGALVLYGRCDEDLGAPYQPFTEALRSLMPCLGSSRLRGLRGVEALLPLVPGLVDVLPDLAARTRADPDTERYALFDAVVALLAMASTTAPVVVILDDLHWAAKPTLLLLRHLLRFGEHARVQILGTYRSTDLDRSHPLAAMLADLHRDGSASRLQLSGLDEVDVSAYVAEAGYDDEELARALASVTGGNPFFLIEALRHVDESGGRWDPSTLPQGVREAVSRRLSRLSPETNKALTAAAVIGSRFALELVERVLDQDLVDAFDEACKAGIVIEEPGGHYRFNHALVRQSLMTELASVRRMRLHQRIAATLESDSGDDDELLAELAHHYFECAWAGNAAKAVDYCRRAADQAMARLAYEGAADLYDKALHALEELDDELPDRDDLQAELLIARCEALLAAGDVVSATGAVSQLQDAASDSVRLGAWGTCFDGQLSMLTDPERLDEIECAVAAAAEKLAELEDAAGEAKAHTVRAGCLGRLGRVGDCETALDQALTAARRAREHRLVNAVLANAPLAALWGPNPVPRAGGRCLDVVRLLRITTGSPVVEATSTRCQGVLDAFRGRAAAGRQLIDSARRSLTELGMRHALLEVDQFAGIVELVADDPAAAETPLRRAYNGFRRMGLDADTAETAALLARACLALDRDDDADELCAESERLSGHALKASITWRTVRAQLLARQGDHEEARRVAEEAVAMAGRTDALVDHGDACLALATVLNAAGDIVGARAAAEKAVDLYEQKGAAALAEKARRCTGAEVPIASISDEAPDVEPDNTCVRTLARLNDAVAREAWDEAEHLFASHVSAESHRKIVGYPQTDLPSGEYSYQMSHFLETGMVRYQFVPIAVRGGRLALTRLKVGTADLSSGAPQDEMLQVVGLDEEGRVALQVVFDVEDIDAAMAELDATYARLGKGSASPPLENAASRADDRLIELFGCNRLDEIGALFSEDTWLDDRRRGLRRESSDRATAVANIRAIAALDVVVTERTLALRGERLCLRSIRFEQQSTQPTAFYAEALEITEVNGDGLMMAKVDFDLDDFDGAIAELDTRYLAGEAAVHARTWSVITKVYVGFNRRELAETTSDWVNIDHRRGAAFAPGDMIAYIQAAWDDSPDTKIYIAGAHRLSNLGAVVTHVARGVSQEGFDAEWRDIHVLAVEGDTLSRSELFNESDLDAALARFDELDRPAPRLENKASRAGQRFLGEFAARNWNAMAEILADDFSSDDRRRVVNAGIRLGRDAQIADSRAIAEFWIAEVTSTVIATRGERLVLIRTGYLSREQGSDTFRTEVLNVAEINVKERITAAVIFDLDDIDAAFKELDRRYLAGEAAAHAHTWSLVAFGYAGLNRHELPPRAPDWVTIDHRQGRAFPPGEMSEYILATWDVAPDMKIHVEAVHRLSSLGAVVTHAAYGTSQEGFDAEWREVNLLMFDGDVVSRSEMFDEADLDAALARFDELRRRAPQLENAASRVGERYFVQLAGGDWDAISDLVADDFFQDDRRRVVGAGVRHGLAAQISDMQAFADLSIASVTSTVVATRGEYLVLSRVRFAFRDQGSEAFVTELIGVGEVNADEKITAAIAFDADDIDVAFTELDRRYLAGESAAHAHTWSIIVRANATLNRRELPATTPDYVSIDHRRATAFAPGDLTAYIRAGWHVSPDLNNYIEAVHQLSDFGAVFTHAAKTSYKGFDAEWRVEELLTIEGELINRCELFDEAEVGPALARFDELSRPAPRLDNAASRVCERYRSSFATRDWDAAAEMLAEDLYNEDRRRVVNAGIRYGRDSAVQDLRAAADLGVPVFTGTDIAIRGDRLALSRGGAPYDDRAGAFRVDTVQIAEIGTEGRIAAIVTFDPDDIGAAFVELEARFVAGEAAAHAHTWSVVARNIAAFNRGEPPTTTPDWVNVDHRRGPAFEPGHMASYIRATWDVAPAMNVYIEAVHRLSDLGTVFTQVVRGTTHDGFDAEWRDAVLLTIDGDLVNRIEVFEEADLDAALARFDELVRPAPRLENAASIVARRYLERFAARDWDAMAEMLVADFSNDDRRRVVGAGVQHGQESTIADMQAIADLWPASVTPTVIATRGERLILMRARFYSSRDQGPEAAFRTEVLCIVEINADSRVVASVAFDLDDIDAAFEELDARYLAGDAATHSRTWSLIARNYVGFNRREFPSAAPDWVTIDHRRGASFEPGDLAAYIHSSWDITPDITVYIEDVHRLSDRGAVFTQVSNGSSQQGFDVEWRELCLVTVDGELVNRAELFDEADLDAALARFDELSRPTRQLDNTAVRAWARAVDAFNRRDRRAFFDATSPDGRVDDRRKGLGARHAGIERRKAADALFEVPESWRTDITPVAVRGSRLALIRQTYRDTAEADRPITVELISVLEVTDDELVFDIVNFDLVDLDAALAELEVRYLAGEAAAHAHTWSAIVGISAAFNRREIPAVTPNWVNIDHRRGAAFAPGELTAYLLATWDLSPQASLYIETVQRLSSIGSVITMAAHATSHDGFTAEWRVPMLLTVDGDRISRCEIFDEGDIGAAIVTFDELSRSTPQAENDATRARQRVVEAFNRRDLDGLLALTAKGHYDDRRKGLRDEGPARPEVVRALLDAPKGFRTETELVAIRGTRFAVTRDRYRDTADHDQPVTAEHLTVTEVRDDGQQAVIFDPDDINGAMAELTARWIASGEVEHPEIIEATQKLFAATNEHDWDAVAAIESGATHVNHRQLATGADTIVDHWSSLRTMASLIPDMWVEVAEILTHSAVGLVTNIAVKGTTPEGTAIELPAVIVILFDGPRVTRMEAFDVDHRASALARFEELSQSAPQLENAATRVLARAMAAFNRRDLDTYLAVVAADGRYEDRRKGLRDEGTIKPDFARTLFFEAATSWQAEVEPVAIREPRLALCRVVFRDHSEVERPIAVETLVLAEVTDDGLMTRFVVFDPDDINGAMTELTARWVASGVVEHPEIIEAHRRLLVDIANQHDWDTFAMLSAGAAYVGHRQLAVGADTIADYISSIRMLASLVPDLWLEPAEILSHSALGVVSYVVVKGTSTEGAPIELPLVIVVLFDGDEISRVETFDANQRGSALARFRKLNAA
ncbi:regulator [Mycolicibacterium celeriflavum]|uniref:BTAD domain-containing putative transcriptional regulator n=1 Tax=Mycolicibacterium celeriflavum TaxID=1249101 RepID=UPI0007FE44A1|nr:BTAD domain-containing putative transcriptional regulator [Mycolicibacterium celeriflavum]OBG13160.1 regulator [Mycolicibacterium celeriflavum]